MSYNQPGPYGGQQPQQPGPYGGGQPQQPGPYGQQPQAPQPGYGYPQQAPQQGNYSQPQQPGPYGQQPQAPYGQVPPPPPPQGGGKKVGLIIAAAAVVVAAAVGGYFVFAGGDDDKGNGKGGSSDVADGGGSGVKDDGPHKLITPATVLTEYKKNDEAGSEGGGMTSGDAAEAEKHGVKNAKDVAAQYQSGDESNPLSQKILQFNGVYGDIADPEKLVDAMFDEADKNAKEGDSSGESMTLVGTPKSYSPAGLDGAVMKCQEMKFNLGGGSAGTGSTAGPSEMSMATCIWGDNSTLGIVITTDMASAMAGKAADLDEGAENTAKFRKEVRVKL
ncbi:hypothetical protein AB0O76_02525 [Streptomyces sp. NPDC086554]|uniref:hypothetical protein n=1 Tax=Streptomyces sp. NPDC086554 TaxID=3154864 RepID=UPI0034245EDE